MLKNSTKQISSMIALMTAMAVVPSAHAQLGGLTGTVDSTVRSTTEATTRLGSQTDLTTDRITSKTEADAELSQTTEATADANIVTDLTAQATATVDGTADVAAETVQQVETQADAAVTTSVETAGEAMTTAETTIDGTDGLGAEAAEWAESTTEAQLETDAEAEAEVKAETSVTADAGATRIDAQSDQSAAIAVSAPTTIRAEDEGENNLSKWLAVGAPVFNASGESMGVIKSFTRNEASLPSAVTLEGLDKPIPVSEMWLEGNAIVVSEKALSVGETVSGMATTDLSGQANATIENASEIEAATDAAVSAEGKADAIIN